MTTLWPLPPYPAINSRKSLSASQLATLDHTISISLQQTLTLPPCKRDTPATHSFISSYVKDAALQTLQSLIWEIPPLSREEKAIRSRALMLAEKVATTAPGLDSQTLLDMAVTYAPSSASLVRSIFVSSLEINSSLPSIFETEAVPAFIQLLSSVHSSGLYGLRKTAYCLSSLMYVAPQEVVRPFSSSKSFIRTLANAYDDGLASIAHSYGGLNIADYMSREPDEWERIWVETKVDLMDSFHILAGQMLKDFGPDLAEQTFDIMFTLIDLPSSSAGSTPFLNRSLLEDYQQSYSLSDALASTLRHRANDDGRVEFLESTLRSFDSSQSGEKNPGALKLLLRSSHSHPGIDDVGKADMGIGKGKAKAEHAPSADLEPDLDMVAQVLDILPHHSPHYIRALLQHPSYPFRGNPEKLIEALLDGTAPGPDDIGSGAADGEGHEYDYRIEERQNIWDKEVMDLAKLKIGKSNQDETSVLQDRKFIEEMKADILRRAEEMYDPEENTEQTKETLSYVDEDEEVNTVKVLGDGEGSDADGDDEETESRLTPEIVLELAYIRDPKLFERDAQTRRGKARSQLRAQTGWDDEQIEGWRIMLERNPQKDRILEKHEFSGNRDMLPPQDTGGGSRIGRGRGRGRGSSGGQGRDGNSGRGRGGGTGGARERAWKDKNKASRGNHNRKRGHDKKMARGGGPSA